MEGPMAIQVYSHGKLQPKRWWQMTG